MFGNPKGAFWGKFKQRQDGKQQWHPLVSHCADVAACVEAILNHTLLGARLATLGGNEKLSEVDVQRLSAIAALHDIGKFNHGFQRKAQPDAKDTAGHVKEVMDLLGSDYALGDKLREVLPIHELNRWCQQECDGWRLLVAAIGHHGFPVGLNDVASIEKSLWEPWEGIDPIAGIGGLVQRVRQWFPQAFVESPSESLPNSAEFEHAFSGLVMLADWLGSDDRLFVYDNGDGDRMTFSREQAARAVVDIGLDVRQVREALGDTMPGFDSISEYNPRPAQRAMMQISRPLQGGLSIIESDTGSGKTEAALVRFMQLFHAGLVDGMVFALPTRSAATQLHGRVVQAMTRAFVNENIRPAVVLAVPGYLQVDDEQGKRLPGFQVLWGDDPRFAERYRGWAAEHPKRYLAGTVVIGTIDQVLLSALRVGHSHLRTTALLRQFLVVDEVHASDAYMNRILESVLEYHVKAGGHALLMSATLGSDARGRLQRAALGGRNQNVRYRSLPLEQALQVPYPVVHSGAVGEQPKELKVATTTEQKLIRLKLASWAGDPERIATEALQAARVGARVLVLRNTVADAVLTQQALERLVQLVDAPLLFDVEGVRTLHSSRFSKTDRELLDASVEERLGKDADQTKGAVVVATQTVQQSLDLDADIMLTDLAPMDVLLQRFGRVHRHAKRNPNRPKGYETAQAIVMTGEGSLEQSIRPNGEASGKHGVGTVYSNVIILELTRQQLQSRDVLRIPEQNRELVERTMNQSVMDVFANENNGLWKQHSMRVTGQSIAQQGVAKLNLVDREELFGDYSFRDGELSERIASRLGENDRRAEFTTPFVGPFATMVKELTIPGWMMHGVELDSKESLEPSDVIPISEGDVSSGVSLNEGNRLEGGQPGGIQFCFGGITFLYDRWGLRKKQTQASNEEDIADA